MPEVTFGGGFGFGIVIPCGLQESLVALGVDADLVSVSLRAAIEDGAQGGTFSKGGAVDGFDAAADDNALQRSNTVRVKYPQTT